MSTGTVFKAVTGWFASRTARAIRPTYLPAFCAPEGHKLGDELQLAYQHSVVHGYGAMRELMQQKPKKGAKTLRTGEITRNVTSVGEQFAKAAATMDPDGLASEIIRLFCVGVPQMNKLDNQRRVATVWSALLAPAVVLREKRGREITVEDLVDFGAQWMRSGTTDLAVETHESPDTRFVSAHPARVYELLTDAASQHEVDHMRLMSSVIEPVVKPVGEYVGARQAAGGVVVTVEDEQPECEAPK
ncbi:hypothetical protein [Massilia varians]|uniref:hypothetical protein n=1 Tax=Massilia varians TaxID=457921 RepID=UPI002557281E|nr:hypothetical protein [Massilia varians]MDK6076169.1 hypothetical protein [Massilia varians]